MSIVIGCSLCFLAVDVDKNGVLNETDMVLLAKEYRWAYSYIIGECTVYMMKYYVDGV